MNDDIDWQAEAGRLDRGVAVQVAGERLTAAGNDIRTVNPADGSPGLDYRGADAAQVDAAVAAAGAAEWRHMPAVARRACLLRLADLVDAHAGELGLHDCLDVGKPISAAVMEAHIAASLCRHFGELADKWHTGQTAPTDPASFSLHLRRPRGVVAAIVPWNYPVINACLKLAPALAAGNAVLLKPSELSPGSAGVLTRLCSEAGMPPGTVACLPGDAVSGALLARHAGVDMLTFTGSTATGKALMRAAGENALKPLLLECGGKSPEIVFDDVRELGADAIAGAIVGGAMANQGQLCVARSRLYVERPLYDELLAAILAELEAMQPGLPLDAATAFGPLASPAQHSRVRGYIDAGVADGAALLVDGRGLAGPNASGCYLGPSLFTGVQADMRIMREEIFGPVLCVQPFDSEDEVVALANDSDFGLAATAWTSDLARANRLARRLETGKLQIRATAEQRFGAGWGQEAEPCRQSGFGVEGGLQGVLSYTRLQLLQVDFPAG